MQLYFATKNNDKATSFDKQQMVDWLGCETEECPAVEGKYQGIRIKKLGDPGGSIAAESQAVFYELLKKVK